MQAVWKWLFLVGLIAGMGGTLWALNHMTTFLDAPNEGVAISIAVLGFILLFVAKSRIDAINRVSIG